MTTLEGPETPDEFDEAQARMEVFARKAYLVQIAVEALVDMFDELVEIGDVPDSISDAMPWLRKAAGIIINEADEWAKQCNTHFDPASPWSGR